MSNARFKDYFFVRHVKFYISTIFEPNGTDLNTAFSGHGRLNDGYGIVAFEVACERDALTCPGLSWNNYRFEGAVIHPLFIGYRRVPFCDPPYRLRKRLFGHDYLSSFPNTVFSE